MRKEKAGDFLLRCLPLIQKTFLDVAAAVTAAPILKKFQSILQSV